DTAFLRHFAGSVTPGIELVLPLTPNAGLNATFLLLTCSGRCSCSPDNMPRRTTICRTSDMRCPKRDKRSVLSDVSFEVSAIIRAGEVDTPIARGHTR